MPAAHGSLALLVTEGEKRYLVRLQRGQRFHCHIGVIEHDALIGQPFGFVYASLTGRPCLLLEPTLADLMVRVKRATQVIYPKDAAWIVQRLGLRSGSVVLEAGTGSGALTTALAWTVAPGGKVITFEGNPEMRRLAEGNLRRFGLLDRVDLRAGYLEDATLTETADAAALDMREPWRCLDKVAALVKPGGALTCFLPTTNQVSRQIAALEDVGCADLRIEELLLRGYKPVPDRLRPEDQMIAHTGYVVSARLIRDPAEPRRWLSRERLRYLDRQAAAARYRQKALQRAAQGEARPKPRLP